MNELTKIYRFCFQSVCRKILKRKNPVLSSDLWNIYLKIVSVIEGIIKMEKNSFINKRYLGYVFMENKLIKSLMLGHVLLRNALY